MAFNQAAIIALFDALESHAQSLGIFERVNGHEPLSAPGLGLSYSIWLGGIAPVRSSGLAATSARVEVSGRVWAPHRQKPPDDIDPGLLTATVTLLGAYSGDLDLGATVRAIDLLGAEGTALSAQAGYVEVEGNGYRVTDLTIPVIVNDVWTQEAT